jgi:hypothetical protein
MALKTPTNHDRRLHVALGRAQAELRQANLGILDTMGKIGVFYSKIGGNWVKKWGFS